MPKRKKGNDSTFEIVDEKGARKNGTRVIWVVAIVLMVLAVAGACFVALWLHEGKNPEETHPIVMGEENDRKQYEYDKQIYDEAGIDYSYDDWKHDKEAEESKNDGQSGGEILGPSKAQEQFEENVDKILDEFQKLTLVETDYRTLIESLERQIDDKLFFIGNHFGWPETMYDEAYDGVRDYIDQIILSFTDKGDLKEGFYGESLDILQAELRNCLFVEKQYRTGYSGVTEKMYDVYRHWGNDLGFADIGEIKMLWFTPYDELVPYDHLGVDCEAKVLTDNGYFVIYMLDMDNEDSTREYRIIDIKEVK